MCSRKEFIEILIKRLRMNFICSVFEIAAFFVKKYNKCENFEAESEMQYCFYFRLVAVILTNRATVSEKCTFAIINVFVAKHNFK